MRTTIALLLALTAGSAHADEFTAALRADTIAPDAPYDGLVFRDAACKRKFGSHGTVAAAARAAFAKCLRAHVGQWQRGEDGETTATREFQSKTDATKLQFTCPKHPTLKVSCVPSTATLAEAHGHDLAGANAALARAIPNTELVATPETRTAMDKAGIAKDSGLIHACFDATGAWRGTYVLRTKVHAAESQMARLIEKQIPPYTIDGVAVAFCAELAATVSLAR